MSNPNNKRLFLSAIAAVVLAVGVHSSANSPVFQHTLPDGGQRGTEVAVTLNGQRLTGTEEVIFYEPGITAVNLEPVNDNQIKAVLKIAPDCRLGEHVMRLRTKLGWTTLHTFYVGPYPTVNEVEPNSEFSTPQKVALNSTVAGTVKSEDIEYFAVEAKKGQRISVEVEGVRLGIGGLNVVFDPYVAILDSKRFELAAADDTPLLKQDAFASVIAPEDGTYYVVLRESAYGGNDACRYRLHIGEFPRPSMPFPAGGQAGQPVTVKFLGDKTGTFEQTLTLAANGREQIGLFAEQGGQVTPSPHPFRVSAMANAMEVEPNNDVKTATPIDVEAPIAFNGILDKDDGADFYRFNAKQGQTLVFRVYARELGSPLDPIVNVFKADGTHLGGNDDAGGKPDAMHVQQMPENGQYVVRILDHLRKGGPDYVYRVEVQPPQAKLTLMMPEVARYDDQNRQFASVPKGNRWMILVQANRENFGGPVKIVCDDLPPGVVMHAPVMPGNVGQIPVIFEAAPDATVGGKLVNLRGHHAENEAIKGTWVQNVALVRGDPNGTPYYTTSVDRLPVAVTEEAPYSVQVMQPKVPLLQNGVMNLRVVAQKKAGFDEEIHVSLPFRPPGFGANPEAVIPKGQTEVYYQVNAAGNAAVGDWPMAVQAWANVAGGQLWTASSHITLKIAPPLVNGEIALTVTEQGKEAEVIVKLAHVTPFEGEATLELVGMPPKCTTQSIKIKSDMQQAVFKVTTDKESPVGQHKSLFCQVVLPKEGEEMRQSLAGGGTLRIDKPREPVVAAPPPMPMPQAAAPAPMPMPEQPKKVLTRLEQLRLEQEARNKK